MFTKACKVVLFRNNWSLRNCALNTKDISSLENIYFVYNFSLMHTGLFNWGHLRCWAHNVVFLLLFSCWQQIFCQINITLAPTTVLILSEKSLFMITKTKNSKEKNSCWRRAECYMNWTYMIRVDPSDFDVLCLCCKSRLHKSNFIWKL